MLKLKNIIDTWNLIEKYEIKGWIQKDDYTILIPKSEHERLLDKVINKKYLKNLTLN